MELHSGERLMSLVLPACVLHKDRMVTEEHAHQLMLAF